MTAYTSHSLKVAHNVLVYTVTARSCDQTTERSKINLKGKLLLPERRGRMERRVLRADLLTSVLTDSFTKLERVTWKVETLSQSLLS